MTRLHRGTPIPYMESLLDILIVVATLVALVSIVDVFRRGLDRGRVAAWILIIAIVPLLGSALYWALRLKAARDPGPTPQSGGRGRTVQ